MLTGGVARCAVNDEMLLQSVKHIADVRGLGVA